MISNKKGTDPLNQMVRLNIRIDQKLFCVLFVRCKKQDYILFLATPTSI